LESSLKQEIGGQKEIRTVDMGIEQGLLSLGNVARIRRAISNAGPENREACYPGELYRRFVSGLLLIGNVRFRNMQPNRPLQ